MEWGHWDSIEFSKDECQEAYDFIVSWRMPEQFRELPEPLQWFLWRELGIPTRHLEREADATLEIALGVSLISCTAKDVDAPCKEAGESRLPDLIYALKNRLRELRGSSQYARVQ